MFRAVGSRSSLSFPAHVSHVTEMHFRHGDCCKDGMSEASFSSPQNEDEAPKAAPTAPVVARFSLRVERTDGYEFRVLFDKDHYGALRMDEPAPLGRDTAPNAARILAAAVGNCLSASLLFCLQRAGAKVGAVTSDVAVELVRNAARRVRIGRVNVTLRPEVDEDRAELARCIETFEDFCVVTQSVRDGLDVQVRVETVAPHAEPNAR